MKKKTYTTLVESLDELLTMYKHDRFEGRGQEYMDAVISSHKTRLAEFGKTMVTGHDSTSGRTIYLIAKKNI